MYRAVLEALTWIKVSHAFLLSATLLSTDQGHAAAGREGAGGPRRVGHGFGHGTWSNRCVQAGRGETATNYVVKSDTVPATSRNGPGDHSGGRFHGRGEHFRPHHIS